MEPTKQDLRQDFLMKIVKPFARFWMFTDTRHTFVYEDGFDRKRTEPYVLLGNHTFMFDVVLVPLPLKKVPFIVASHNLFVKQPTKFLLSKIAHAIPKTKSASDIRTARELIGAVKRGYPICIFPEGNTTFTGETTYIEESTMKLIKKLNIDVVTVKVEGGYLSKPRWATSKRKNRQAKFTFRVTIPKEKLAELSVEEINKIINDELYHNDYDYQRTAMIPHKGKKLAEGIENILYICPECNSVSTIKAHGNTIECTNCKTKGQVNEYGFIEGFRFDNTVDWDRYQRDFDHKLKDEVISSPCFVQLVNDKTMEFQNLGKATLTYKKQKFIFSDGVDLTFHLKDIKNPLVTLRRDFNFNVGEQHYLIKIEQYVSSFLRIAQEKY